MRYLTKEEENEYQRLVALAGAAQTALDELMVATVQSSIPDEAKISTLNWIERAAGFKGLGYFLSPQPEWMGGEVTKVRAPHIEDSPIAKPVSSSAVGAPMDSMKRDLLIQAIEESGFSVSGPTDHRAAEHSEPKWVCNARAVLAQSNSADMPALPVAGQPANKAVKGSR